MDKPKAKPVKFIPSGKRLPYWDKWEFECVDCGTHYYSGHNDCRTSPYCGTCKRRHDAERAKINAEIRRQKEREQGRQERQSEIISLIKFFEKTWNKESHKRLSKLAVSELIEFIMQNETSEEVERQLKTENMICNNKCIWTKRKGGYVFKYIVPCYGYSDIETIAGFKRCPYCGKLIDLIEEPEGAEND